MKFFRSLRLFLSILGVLVLHQFVVLLYTLGVAIGFGIDNVDAFNEGAITEAMLGEAVLAQATNSLIFAGVVMVGLLWMLNYSKRESFVKNYRFHTKPTRIQLFLAITIGFSAVFFSSFIVQALARIFPISYVAYIEAFENLELGSPLSFFLAVVIMAPLFEEILFRGWIFDQIQRKLSVGLAVVLSGILFGVYHLNVFQGTFASILGIVLGLSLLWTNSIWVPIIIHFVNNGLAWLFGLDAIAERIANAGVYFEISAYFFAFVLFPVSIYTLYTERSAFTLHSDKQKLDTISLEDTQ